MRPLVGEFPGEWAGLTVCKHDCWADAVEESSVACVVVASLERSVVLRWDLGGVEGVEDGVACVAGAGPLCV